MLGVDVKKNVVVTISSDKGLCGGINSTSVKISKGLRKLNSGISSKQLNLFCLFVFLLVGVQLDASYELNIFIVTGPEKGTKYVILGEKAKAILVRDSKKDIELILTELQKNPLSYTQVCHCVFICNFPRKEPFCTS